MATKSVRYTPEFKRQMVDLARSVRDLVRWRRDRPTAWTIALDADKRSATPAKAMAD